MNATAQLLDTTVTAQDAPLGVLLWPVRSPEYARNFTLAAIEQVHPGILVRWVYESGKTRDFDWDAEVAVRVSPADWATIALGKVRVQMAVPASEVSTHPADDVATRPTSTLRVSHIVGVTS